MGKNHTLIWSKWGNRIFIGKRYCFFNSKTGKRFLKLFKILLIKKMTLFPFSVACRREIDLWNRGKGNGAIYFHLITIFFDFVVSVCLDAHLTHFLSGYWTGRLSGPQNIGGKKTLTAFTLGPRKFRIRVPEILDDQCLMV